MSQHVTVNLDEMIKLLQPIAEAVRNHMSHLEYPPGTCNSHREVGLYVGQPASEELPEATVLMDQLTAIRKEYDRLVELKRKLGLFEKKPVASSPKE